MNKLWIVMAENLGIMIPGNDVMSAIASLLIEVVAMFFLIFFLLCYIVDAYTRREIMEVCVSFIKVIFFLFIILFCYFFFFESMLVLHAAEITPSVTSITTSTPATTRVTLFTRSWYAHMPSIHSLHISLGVWVGAAIVVGSVGTGLALYYTGLLDVLLDWFYDSGPGTTIWRERQARNLDLVINKIQSGVELDREDGHKTRPLCCEVLFNKRNIIVPKFETVHQELFWWLQHEKFDNSLNKLNVVRRLCPDNSFWFIKEWDELHRVDVDTNVLKNQTKTPLFASDSVRPVQEQELVRTERKQPIVSEGNIVYRLYKLLCLCG